MSTFRLRRPSPATLIATVALFVALGGTGYAAFSLPKNSVGTKQLKNNAVTTSKIKNNAVTTSKIKNGTVTASKINTSGLTAPNALHANNADNATSAATAANANQLGGVAAASYAQTSSLSGGAFTAAPGVLDENFINLCSTAGNPNAWVDRSNDVNVIVGYARDAAGFVHLEGSAFRCGSAGTTIFTLPAGFRPVAQIYLTGIQQAFFTETPTPIEVHADGSVVSSGPVTAGNSASLDGLTFRCGPSGSDGCP
jgi:hypothetical protein